MYRTERNAPFSGGRAALATALVFSVCCAATLQLSTPRAQALTTGLPSHFSFGLHAPPGDNWPGQSGIPWDYRYTYLAGGVNTNTGWETWNTNGQYALYYAQNAANEGRIPMFPYYELLQSSGSCGGCPENQKDITNLNTPGLMQAYYQNFALLMKRLGPGTYDSIQGFGKTTIVNVEPDFSGGYTYQAVTNNSTCFGFCTAQGNNPAYLKAAVASSGFSDVAAYPDTYAGFTQALAHLRDLYAPNVLLGWNISNWATGVDIGMDTSSTIDASALGQQLGTFFRQTGAHDLLFDDPLDRDAGQYKALYGQNRWWDRLNVNFPNFTRWEQYIQAAATADGAKSILLWQVPIGNQYFDTVNNTNGHYQDNRAEYIFGHITELMQAGVVGVMFGAGNSGNTVESDATGDGVTNPASFCTSDGVSSGQICNNHTSTVADDDGGYLRMQGQAYYANPVPLSGASGTPTSTSQPTATYTTSATASPSTVAPGASEALTVSVTSSTASSALVDLEIYDSANTKVFQQYWDNQTFAAGQTLTFSATWQTSSTTNTGTYRVAVGIFKPGWAGLITWNNSAATFAVGAAPTSSPTPAPTNTPIPAPTNTPTATPTWTPVPATATATATSGPAQQSFTTTGSASPSIVVRGNTVNVAASVKSASASTVLVDLEIYDSAGTKVYQRAWNNQRFTAGQTRSYSTSWRVPMTSIPGTYTVKIGIFAPGWTTLYNWNNGAATFTVG